MTPEAVWSFVALLTALAGTTAVGQLAFGILRRI